MEDQKNVKSRKREIGKFKNGFVKLKIQNFGKQRNRKNFKEKIIKKIFMDIDSKKYFLLSIVPNFGLPIC